MTLASINASVPENEELGMAAISASEILVGLYLGSPEFRQARAAFVEEVFLAIPSYDFDLRIARLHAEIWARLSRAGNMINRHDLMIGTTALSLGFGVLTYNVRDFDRIPGLIVQRPSWP